LISTLLFCFVKTYHTKSSLSCHATLLHLYSKL
jgi:hypothetical protein